MTTILDAIFSQFTPDRWIALIHIAYVLVVLLLLRRGEILVPRAERLRRRFGIRRVLPYIAAMLLLIVGLPSLIPDLAEEPRDAALPLPAPVCSRPQSQELVLFLHGWNGSSDTFLDFPRLVCGDVRFAGADVRAISYPTLMMRRNLTLSRLSQWLLLNFHGEGFGERYSRIAVVAHSMGGLLARSLVIDARLDSTRELPVGVLVEVATPHDGADLAAIATTLRISSELTAPLQPGSEFLDRLRTQWDLMRPRPETTCYSSEGDWVVRPRSAFAGCDRTGQHAIQWGHTELVKVAEPIDPRYRLPAADLERYFAIRASDSARSP